MTVIRVDSSGYNTRQAADAASDDFDLRLSSQNAPVRRSFHAPKAQQVNPVQHGVDSVADRKPITDYSKQGSLSSDNLPLASKAPASRRKKLLVGGSVFLVVGGSIGTGVGVSEEKKKKRKDLDGKKGTGTEIDYVGGGGVTRRK